MSFRRSPKTHPVTLRASLQAKRFPRFEWCQHVHSNNPATSFATLGMSRTWQPLVHVGGIISVGRGITGCITKTLANKDNRVSVVPNYRIWTTLLDSSQPTTRISMQLDQNTTSSHAETSEGIDTPALHPSPMHPLHHSNTPSSESEHLNPTQEHHHHHSFKPPGLSHGHLSAGNLENLREWRGEERKGEKTLRERERELSLLYVHGKLPKVDNPYSVTFLLLGHLYLVWSLGTDMRKTCVYKRLDCVFNIW